MVQIVWSIGSLRDLHEIYTYIAKDSEFHARIQIERIEFRVGLLERYPKLGKSLPEFHLWNYRELIVQPYRVIYRLSDDARLATIVAIVHGRRLMFR